VQREATPREVILQPLATARAIILITSAGGTLGAMIQHACVAASLDPLTSEKRAHLIWMVCKLSGFTERETLTSWTPSLAVISLVRLAEILIVSRLLPLTAQ
jgi:H+/gluconate symporter-like permease